MNKIYCKKCHYHIPLIEAIQTEYEDGRDICGLSISFEKTPAGHIMIKRNITREICPECRNVIAEKGTMIYTKCDKRNRKLNCSDFKKKTIWDLINDLFKNINTKIKLFFDRLNFRSLTLFFIWGIFHTWLIIFKGILDKEINLKILILYIIMSIIYFAGQIKNNGGKQ